MEFTILGRTQLIVNGRSVDLGAAKQRALLTLLLINLGKPVTVETIIAQLWKGRSRDEIRANLHSLVSRLRRVLKRAEVPCKLRNEGDAYCLVLNAQLVDYHRFRRQAELGRSAAREGNHVQARRLLRAATDMWQGNALADLRTDWAAQRRNQMESHDRLPAHYALINSELELREHADALHQIVLLMDEYPLDEILARQRLQALDGLGRFAEAIEFYTQFRRRYWDEYGTPPIEANEVYSQILRKREGPGRPTTGLAAPLQQVPRPVHHFTGRGDLLAALDVLLPDTDTGRPAPVVALTGMGGIGKTALAVYWAYRHRDHFPDGQLFHNLNGYSPGSPVTADDVMAKFLEDLGVPPDLIPITSDQRQTRLNSRLANRKILVVLDNVRDPNHVRPLLAATTNCSVLVTSRALLTGLAVRDSVRIFSVLPMPITESIDLLRNEIAEARFAQEPPDFHALAELSGGLPLMLKLIAHRAATRPHTELTDLVRELGGHHGLISPSSVDDETATPAGVFSWSYNALPVDIARAFRLLGLHPGPRFSSYAAGALLGQGLGDTEQRLNALAEVHLVQPDGLHHYRFHDLLHDYAANRAHHDEPTNQRLMALTRMIDWYLRTAANADRRLAAQSEPVPQLTNHMDADPLTFDTDDEALYWCQQERSNLIAVTHCAAEHGLHEYAWRIPATMGEAFVRSGFQNDFLEIQQVALTSAQVLNNREAEIGCLNNLGRIYFGRHDHHRALAQVKAALDIARDTGNDHLQAASQYNLGCAYLELGEVSAAIQTFLQTRQRFRELDTPHGEAHSLHRLADAYRRLGDQTRALDYYSQALSIRHFISDLPGQGDTLSSIGELHYERGEYDRARHYTTQALEIHEQTQAAPKIAMALITLAAIHHDTQSFRKSADYAERAADLCSTVQDSHALVRALRISGCALEAMGDHDGAREQFNHALTILGDTEGPEVSLIRAHLDPLEGTAGAVPRPRPESSSMTDRPLLS